MNDFCRGLQGRACSPFRLRGPRSVEAAGPFGDILVNSGKPTAASRGRSEPERIRRTKEND
jgi:hypothetical protein